MLLANLFYFFGPGIERWVPRAGGWRLSQVDVASRRRVLLLSAVLDRTVPLDILPVLPALVSPHAASVLTEGEEQEN